MVMYTRYSEKRLIGSIFVSIRKVIVTQKITRVLRTSIAMEFKYPYMLSRNSSYEITFSLRRKRRKNDIITYHHYDGVSEFIFMNYLLKVTP